MEDSGLPMAEVIAEFPELDDLVVAIASRQAARVTQPLRLAMQSGGFDDVRSELIEFGVALRTAYSSVLIGFLRVAMTEGSRHKDLRRRVYGEGPAAVTAALNDYLDGAAGKGKLAFANSGYAAEALHGHAARAPFPTRSSPCIPEELTSYGSAEEAVEQAVDRFLGGCRAREAAS